MLSCSGKVGGGGGGGGGWGWLEHAQSGGWSRGGRSMPTEIMIYMVAKQV